MKEITKSFFFQKKKLKKRKNNPANSLYLPLNLTEFLNRRNNTKKNFDEKQKCIDFSKEENVI